LAVNIGRSGGMQARAVLTHALLICASCWQRLQKALYFVRQIRVNHKSITSHAPRATADCSARMAQLRKFDFEVNSERTTMTAQEGKDLLIKSMVRA